VQMAGDAPDKGEAHGPHIEKLLALDEPCPCGS